MNILSWALVSGCLGVAAPGSAAEFHFTKAEVEADGSLVMGWESSDGDRVEKAWVEPAERPGGIEWHRDPTDTAGAWRGTMPDPETGEFLLLRVIRGAGDAAVATAAAGWVELRPGVNWVAPWGQWLGESMESALASRLPAGPDPGRASVIEISGDPARSSGEMRAWLEASASGPGLRVEHGHILWPLPVGVPVRIELPANGGPVQIPMVCRLPDEPVSIGIKGGGAVTPVAVPRVLSWGLGTLLPPEGGFSGGPNPVLSDRVWRYDNRGQEVRTTYWYDAGTEAWRRTAPAFSAVTGAWGWRPGDAVFLRTAAEHEGWTWRLPPALD